MKNKLYIFSISIICLLQFGCDYDVVPPLESNPCATIVCENDGACSGGICECPPGFGGVKCEIDRACLAIDCQNCGTCDKGECDCPEGITGDNCEAIEEACNQDCTAGSYGGNWNAESCSCINETEPIKGCTDSLACNYNENANCEDGSCILKNTACDDPCNVVLGCTNDTACNYNSTACVDDGTCIQPPCTPGCTDPCSDNYDPDADNNNGLCLPYDTTCNTDCSMGDMEVWDTENCNCRTDVRVIYGCTNLNACNFDISANCDDNSCDFGNTTCPDACNEPNPNDSCDITTDSFDAATCTVTNTPNCPTNTTFNAATCNCDVDTKMGCTNPCANNYDSDAVEDDGSCEPYNKTCNQDCTAGSYGGIWDSTSCACINEIEPIKGCTDTAADNYNSAANCDDGSCVFDPCNFINCLNGGDCIDGECFCPTGFAGTNCELVKGCTNNTACNYKPQATLDDGSCFFGPQSCEDPCRIPSCPPGEVLNFMTCNCQDDSFLYPCLNCLPFETCEDGICICDNDPRCP